MGFDRDAATNEPIPAERRPKLTRLGGMRNDLFHHQATKGTKNHEERRMNAKGPGLGTPISRLAHIIYPQTAQIFCRTIRTACSAPLATASGPNGDCFSNDHPRTSVCIHGFLMSHGCTRICSNCQQCLPDKSRKDTQGLIWCGTGVLAGPRPGNANLLIGTKFPPIARIRTQYSSGSAGVPPANTEPLSEKICAAGEGKGK